MFAKAFGQHGAMRDPPKKHNAKQNPAKAT